jgi:hypothetical protein
MPCRVGSGYTQFTVRAVDANEGSVFGVSRKAGANDVVNHRKLQTQSTGRCGNLDAKQRMRRRENIAAFNAVQCLLC